jgi:hypothetical protein
MRQFCSSGEIGAGEMKTCRCSSLMHFTLIPSSRTRIQSAVALRCKKKHTRQRETLALCVALWRDDITGKGVNEKSEQTRASREIMPPHSLHYIWMHRTGSFCVSHDWLREAVCVCEFLSQLGVKKRRACAALVEVDKNPYFGGIGERHLWCSWMLRNGDFMCWLRKDYGQSKGICSISSKATTAAVSFACLDLYMD